MGAADDFFAGIDAGISTLVAIVVVIVLVAMCSG